jgi:cytochrome c biogenesis protein CcmG/thiol:disulfide interchange protein DsbE
MAEDIVTSGGGDDPSHPQDGADGLREAQPQATPVPVERQLSRKAAWLAMGAVALALALVSFAPGVSQFGGFGEEMSPEDAALVGRPAPLQYTLKDMNGVDVKLASFKGKVILLNFWATWCGPCELEIPWLVEIQKAYPDDVVILGVSIDDTADQLKPYAEKMKMNYPVLLGLERQDMQDAYGPLYGVPVSVFIDRDGVIARRHSGIFSKEQFEREIKSLL